MKVRNYHDQPGMVSKFLTSQGDREYGIARTSTPLPDLLYVTMTMQILGGVGPEG